MNKILLIVIYCLFLSGCYQKVNHAEIEKAKQFYSDVGIDYIRESIYGETIIYCLDGSSENDFNIILLGELKLKQ